MAEYIPSWQLKKAAPSTATLAPPPPPPAPPAAAATAPPAHKPSGISVTNTATNSSHAYGGGHPSYGTPVQAPQRGRGATSPKVGGSPDLSLRVPMRMSPAIAPAVHLNVDAESFVPGRGGMSMHALEELPSSTAEMETPAAAAAAPVTAAPYKPAAWTPSHQQRATASPLITHVTLGNLSEEEIRAISQRSSLNLAASTYSSKRTLTRLMIISPITLMPTAGPRPGAELDDDDDAERNLAMMLDDLWCLFYLPQVGESIKEDTYNPTLVFRIDSVPTFWKVVNNIPQPTQLPQCTLYLFRDGIDPRWEDPANLSGGIVKVKINHSHSTVFNSYSADPTTANSQEKINEAWELLLCRTIGDSWSSSVRKLINGIALKVRGRAYVLEVWVTRQTQELMRDLAELWQGVLGEAFATVYYPHAALQERSHQAATAMAAKKAQQQQSQGKRHHK